MPNGDGTGPDGNGPKKEDKGFPQRYRKGQCRRQGGSGGRQGKGRCREED